METSESTRLLKKAKKIIPGGVNSPVRAWREVGGNPMFIEKAAGSKITDVDGNKYIDYVMSYGPLILGHAHPTVLEAVKEAAENGTTFGSCTKLEVELAEAVSSAVSTVDKVRFVCSGTEAVMTALRLARAYTRKNKIIKFDGCYHGHCNSMLVSAGSALTGKPDSLGVPESVAADTLSVEYNNLEALESAVKNNDAACVIIEPVCANNGLILPKDGFLAGLRELTEEHDTILIFDEVITGFRLCYGGASDYFNVKPDLTTFGKIIGGGLPVGAVGGRSDIIDQLAPDGKVFQAGTLSGNPVAVSAGLATLGVLDKEDPYKKLAETARVLRDGLTQTLKDAKVSCIESMLSISLGGSEAYTHFFRKMLEAGVYPPPSPNESWFVSTAHTRKDVDFTLGAVRESL